MNRYIPILLMIFGLPLRVPAQQNPGIPYTVTGKVMDSLMQKPAAYATIIIAGEENEAVASLYSGEDGSFKTGIAKTGKYKLLVTSTEFENKEIWFSVVEGKATLSLGIIYLSRSAGNMQEVTVTSRKRIIEQRPGMLIYNAENDLTNKGGTAADVLRKAPVLNVDAQGNVTMRGSANLKILINGKYSGQMARSPADALNMMPADIIKSVEIITTPSAKYDAEGAAGVINIITKKGRKTISGALEASGSNMEQMLNPRLSAAAGKWNFNMAGHLHRLRKKSSSRLERIQKENGEPSLLLNQQSAKDNTAPHGSADIGIVYAPDSVTEINLGIVSWFGKWPDDNEQETVMQLPDGNILQQYLQSTAEKSQYLGSDFNLSYNRKFKQPGREVTILAQFSPSRDKSDYNYRQADQDKTLLYKEVNKSVAMNREWTLQADYIQPLSSTGRYTLESGVKIIKRSAGNEYNIAASDPQQPEELEPQPSRSDHFKYSQDVYAAYSILKINMQNNWYAEAGARLEKTNLEGNFIFSNSSFKNRFTNFIPTATLSKKFNENQTIGLSYTKRLTRPYIWDLNPNADASDPKNIETGNPYLNPEIAHQAEFTYGLNEGAAFFFNAALFWKQTNNAIMDYTVTGADGVSVTSKRNLAANRQYGLNFSSFVSLSAKWSLNGNINLNYLDYSSSALQLFREGWAADIDLNTTFKLPQHWTLQLFGKYDSREVTLQGYQSYSYFYSVAVKKELPAKKIILTLSSVNPFSKFTKQVDFTESAYFTSALYNRWYFRAFKFTVNWEFGNMFKQRSGKKIMNDDVKEKGKG